MQSQVDGINVILDGWEEEKFTDLRWLAYMLGTTFHETAGTMEPIREYGSNAYLTKMYDPFGARGGMARKMGNTHPGDGVKYCGRGYVQLTWCNNYRRMGALVHEDLVNHPDLALHPPIAAKIMFLGMTGLPQDTFSGVNLQKYFNPTTEDWTGARHIVNGTDHADMIADTARDFYAAIRIATTPPLVASGLPVV